MTEQFKVLICGDRHWSNRASIAKRINQLPKHTMVIHGGAHGADSIAGEEALKAGLTVHVFPAEWERYGRAAGPKRNLQMLNQNPQLVIAFHSDLSKSKGTSHTVREARKRNIPVYVVTE